GAAGRRPPRRVGRARGLNAYPGPAGSDIQRNMATPEVGSQFAGYRIESLVGRGGMGVVYRATQLDLGRTVALKLIAPEALEDEAARTRFVSEARHAASIEHPHVVPI